MPSTDRHTRSQYAYAHTSPRLRLSLRLFVVVAIVLLAAVIYEAIRYHAAAWQIILGLLVGMAFGIVFARMYHISWDEDAQHVTNNIDIYGIVVLILYIAFDFSRSHLVHIFTHSSAVPAISLALLAGAMYGRVLGSGRAIMKILREQEVLSFNRD